MPDSTEGIDGWMGGDLEVIAVEHMAGEGNQWNQPGSPWWTSSNPASPKHRETEAQRCLLGSSVRGGRERACEMMD